MTAEILSFETGRPAEIAPSSRTTNRRWSSTSRAIEGPLDLLLTLARQQKVDLHKISILALADQYLVFIEAARKMRLELAADYLVMAAWLAYLKSRLLLPEPPSAEGPSAEEMATALANRLRRLEAIREAAEPLDDAAAARPRHLRARRARGDRRDQASAMDRDAVRSAVGLCDAAPAHACSPRCIWRRRTVWSLAEARASLERLVGVAEDWSRLDDLSAGLRGRALAAGHGVRLELRRGARTGARRRRSSCTSAKPSRRCISASAPAQSAEALAEPDVSVE